MTLITLPGVRKGRSAFHSPRPPMRDAKNRTFTLSGAAPSPSRCGLFNPVRVSGVTQEQACQRLAEHTEGRSVLPPSFVAVLWRLVEAGE